jgi:hypothetical protein
VQIVEPPHCSRLRSAAADGRRHFAAIGAVSSIPRAAAFPSVCGPRLTCVSNGFALRRATEWLSWLLT